MLQNPNLVINIATVFHRILDFKTGLNFYSDPFFYFMKSGRCIEYQPGVPAQKNGLHMKAVPLTNPSGGEW